MTDVFTHQERAEIMRAIRGKDTKPEHTVRRLLHRLGYGFRLHVRELPGCPDLVFPARHKVIFVNGCFWHRHSCRKGRSMPRTRVEFWKCKLQGNQRRDQATHRALNRQGWGVLHVWECQMREPQRVAARIKRFLDR